MLIIVMAAIIAMAVTSDVSGNWISFGIMVTHLA